MADTGKGPGYAGSDVIACQFSLYPLRQAEIGVPIRAAVEAVRAEGCTVRVGNLSTLAWGDEDQVFAALRAAFRAAQRSGSAVMTATFVAGPPTDELVGEIQQGVDGCVAPGGAPRSAPSHVPSHVPGHAPDGAPGRAPGAASGGEAL